MNLTRYSLKKLIFSILIFFTANTYSLNIILDLQGVCIITNTKAALSQLPKKALALYITFLRQNPKISFYRILHAIKPTQITDVSIHPHDDNGKPLPQLMVDWMQGTIHPNDLLSLIITACNQHPEWFKHGAEKTIVLALASLIFTPHSLAKLQKLNPLALEFVHKCKKAGHKVYILSNWDAPSFELLKKEYPHFFDLFDGIGVSGHMNAVKPHPDIYNQLVTTHQLKKEECWFIDDQTVNIDGARKIGINTILCPLTTNWLQKLPDLLHVWNQLPVIQPNTVAAITDVPVLGICV